MLTPSSSRRPATRVTVAGAAPSTIRTSPKPGLLAWWSTTTETPASSSSLASSPSRPGDAASRLTNTSGEAGTADDGTSPSAPGSQLRDSGSVNGSGKVVRTRAPRRRSPSASARVLPSASASGCTWPERTTVARAPAASARTEAAVRDGVAVARGDELLTGRCAPRSPGRRRQGMSCRRRARRQRRWAPRRSRRPCPRGSGRRCRAPSARRAPTRPRPRLARTGPGPLHSRRAPALYGGALSTLIGSPGYDRVEVGEIVVAVVLRRPAVRVRLTGVLGTLAGAGEFGVGVPGPLERLLELAGGVGDDVGDEGERRDELDARLLAHGRPQDTGRAGEGSRGVGDLGVVAVNGVEDGRLAEVAGHLGVGDGHHAQPGVLDLGLDRGGDDLTDAHRQLACAGRVGHRTSSIGAHRRYRAPDGQGTRSVG